MESWEVVKQTLPIHTVMTGTVTQHEAYGMYIDVGLPFRELVQITDFIGQEKMDVLLYPEIGKFVVVKILGFTNDNRNQIWLGFDLNDQ